MTTFFFILLAACLVLALVDMRRAPKLTTETVGFTSLPRLTQLLSVAMFSLLTLAVLLSVVVLESLTAGWGFAHITAMFAYCGVLASFLYRIFIESFVRILPSFAQTARQ